MSGNVYSTISKSRHNVHGVEWRDQDEHILLNEKKTYVCCICILKENQNNQLEAQNTSVCSQIA